MPRDLFPDIPDAIEESTNEVTPRSESSGLMEQLGFSGGKPQSLGSIFSEDAKTAANSPGMHALQGAQDAIQQMMSLGLLPIKPQGEGTAYDIGKGVGNIAGFVGGGELLSPLAKALPLLRGTGLTGSIARNLSGGALAGMAENPDDRLKGATTGAALQGALDAVGLPFKAVKPLAELFNPKKFSGETLDSLRNALAESEKKELLAYEPFNRIAKNHELGDAPNFLETLDENASQFGNEVNKKYRAFNKSPTLDKAHSLQSEMFKSIKQESSKLDPNYDKIKALQESRKGLQKDILEGLRAIDKDAYEGYKKGADIHKKEVSPYYSTSSLQELLKGDVEDVEPKRLYDALKQAKESKNKLIPNEHALREAFTHMQSKMRKGKAAQYAIPLLAGGIGSQVIHPGLGSLGGGLFAGAVGGIGGTKLAEFIQNPEIAKIFQRLGPYARGTAQIGRAGLQNFNQGT